jgi:cytochrome c biogenesis protein CcmG, thiol:disulfide interchange protein DsbE
VSRWIALAPLVVLAALAALFAGYALHHDPHVNPAALVGRQAPVEALQPLAGGAPEPLGAQVKGPVLIHFFASWCAPCAEEMPALMALKAEGVPIIGVAYKDAPTNSQAFLAKYGNPYVATLTDPSGRAGVDFGVSGVPETFAVGADGKVVAKSGRPMSPADAESLVEALGR